jgi:hypothetical protein
MLEPQFDYPTLLSDLCGLVNATREQHGICMIEPTLERCEGAKATPRLA